MENVKEWLKNNGSDYGLGSGVGFGYGCNYAYGSGSGFGHDDSCGDGSGYGSGRGFSYDDGCGDGSGYGSGIKQFDGKEVSMIDGVQTIITHIKDNAAKGFILKSDFTLTPCFVTKGNGYFAHGKTLREAIDSLSSKIFESTDSEEAIERFIETFKKDKKYSGKDFFDWHHYLTGSCLMGREFFVRNHGLSLEAMYTVDEFIAVCENDYGSSVIKQLKERWEKAWL